MAVTSTIIRGAQAKYNCQHCHKLFTARVADRNRGWAKFCGKKCKQADQEKVKKIIKILKANYQGIRK